MSVTFSSASEAAVSFTTGKTDKAGLLNYAKTLDMIGVLTLLKANALTIEEASPLLNKPEKAQGKIFCKVSQKGAVSMYGLQRMPVSLYVEQWERVYALVGQPLPKEISDLIGKEFEIKEADFKTDDQKALLETIKAGKRTKARYANGKAYVQVRLKTDGE
jgi:hypothetical protein